MSRDDSVLLTGASSASFAKEREVKQEKALTRKKLLPAAEIVAAEFDKEIAELSNLDYIEVEKMLDTEHFKAELMARKKTIDKLRTIKNRLNNLLRDNKGEQAEEFPE